VRIAGYTRVHLGVHSDLAATLERVLATTDKLARKERDPVRFVHRYADPLEAELAALVASSIAFGNVTTILAKGEELFARIGPGLGARAVDRRFLRRRLQGFVHRLYDGDDLAGLLHGARRIQLAHGSLGAFVSMRFAAAGSLRIAASELVLAIRREGGFEGASRATGGGGAAHLLPDPAGPSASKRLQLFLRWMVRPADGVDLGLWPAIPTSALTMPLDVHIHRLSRNLGLTARNDVSFRTATEITVALARIDPVDPVRFDFALCHLGMVGDCPSRREPVSCDGCGVKSVCRHW
jgi:uncharacterized protein (TIGR02757 family)